MSVDPRDRALGQLLDDAVHGIDPDLEIRLPWIRRSGSARRGLRWTAIVASLGVFVGGIGWTALALREGGMHMPAARVEIPYADTVLELPPGWSGASAAGLRVAALFASTSNEALSGLIRGCRREDDNCGIRRIDVARLGPQDAFVEVWATGVPLAPDRSPPLLPPFIGPDVFLDGPLHLGQPVRTLTGRGTTSGIYEVRYWIGPRGGEEVRSSVASILARLDLPTPIAPSVPVTDGWNTYLDSEVGLSVRYPLAWHLQPFSEGCDMVDGRGILVSNVAHEFRPPGAGAQEGCPANTWDMRGLPPNLVAVEVRHFEGGPAPMASREPDTAFPLSLDDAQSLSAPREISYGAPEPHLVLPFQVNRDTRWTVTVWFGPDASREHRLAAAEMVASVAFASTPESLGSGDAIRIPWANAALDLPEGWFGASGVGGTSSALAVIAATRREAVADLVHGCGGPPGHECRMQGLVIEDLRPSDAFVEVWADYPPNGTTTGPQLPGVISRSIFSVEREYLGQPVLVLQGQGTNVFVFTIRFWAGSKSGDSGDEAIFEILSMLRLPVPPS